MNKTPKSKQTADGGSMMRLVRCECSMAISMLGDGCRYCNPELGAELKWNSEADEYNQWDDLGQDERDKLIADFISANAALHEHAKV
jgi:hypothetical protein